jgi:RHH-type proline utilization regulon transcriptional repressor/proline dehydrogenase/delta 1-pyrroline-5-carboxylate dehydrogenase
VDSSALAEQVVADVLASAFDSAGQRCSALRLLCVQDDVADRVLAMLRGAMAELRLGHPARLDTDVGPVIDAEARDGIEAHVAALAAKGRPVYRATGGADAVAHGTFVPPTLIELERVDELGREVFGPVLHVVRWRREALDTLVGQINRLGYGLTMGLHTRIDETIARVTAQAAVGNLYVNRNMVGAVVGVQPFGGEGLSGTGPKAGGPLALLRLLSHRPQGAAREAVRACGAEADGPAGDTVCRPPALQALADWAAAHGRLPLAQQCARFAAESPAGLARRLDGPTGERNVYRVLPRERVLGLADADNDRLTQLAAMLAVGAQALWPADPATGALHDSLPLDVQAHITRVADWRSPATALDAVLHHGDREARLALAVALGQRPGPLVALIALEPGDPAVPLERLVMERALSVNTAAAGGNASLMTLG